jgi:hypothetical protein
MRPIAFSGTAADITTASKLVKAAHDLSHFHGYIQVAEVQRLGPFLWELSKARFHESSAASMTASYQMIRCAVPELMYPSLCMEGLREI